MHSPRCPPQPRLGSVLVNLVKPKLALSASTHGYGVREEPGGLAASSPTSESRCSHMALTWSFDSRSMSIAAATLCTFLVPVPVAHVSLTAATAALSTLW